MIKITEVFDCLSGNSDLTEEFIYQHINLHNHQKNIYNVLSGSTDEHECLGLLPLCKDSKSRIIQTFEDKKGILIARKGKAGSMRYLDEGKYMINDNAYILFLKESIKDKYNILENEEETFLKYFIYSYTTQVKEYATTNDNATWNKTSFFNEFVISENDFSLETLIRFKQTYNSLETIANEINRIYEKVVLLDKQIISLKPSTNNKMDTLGNIFAYCSRNDILSEEGIYHRQPTGDDIIVLSGSASKLVYGKVSKQSKKIHFVEKTQCLHLVSRGSAGTLTYLPKGDYATNTNAFLLFLKQEYKKAHNIDTEDKEETILRYYLYFLQPIFFEISSKSDLGVFPLTNAVKTLQIPIIDYSDEIKSVVNTIKSFEQIKKHIFSLKNKYEILKNKQLIINN